MGYSHDEWTPLIVHEKWLVTGMPSPMIKSNQINVNKTPPGLLLVRGTHYFGEAMDWCLLVVGEYKLYHSVWEPPIMCVAWKISISLDCYVDNESMPLKILFISISKTRAPAPLQIPVSLCEGPIYLLLCWVVILLLKSTSWRAPLSFASIAVSLHWVWIDWISFTMNYNV